MPDKEATERGQNDIIGVIYRQHVNIMKTTNNIAYASSKP